MAPGHAAICLLLRPIDRPNISNIGKVDYLVVPRHRGIMSYQILTSDGLFLQCKDQNGWFNLRRGTENASEVRTVLQEFSRLIETLSRRSRTRCYLQYSLQPYNLAAGEKLKAVQQNKAVDLTQRFFVPTLEEKSIVTRPRGLHIARLLCCCCRSMSFSLKSS